MSLLARVDVTYRSALKDALVIQIPLILLGGLAADGGVMAAICLRAAVAFWIATAIILIRRPAKPSRWDLAFIRFGYLVLLPLTLVLLYKVPPLQQWFPDKAFGFDKPAARA